MVNWHQARMTQLVVDAERRGELPPMRISPSQLQTSQQPSQAELRAGFGLHRLARAIARALCYHRLEYPSGRLAVRDLPEEPARLPEWVDRVAQAALRAFIVGAALAGTYKEPMFKARAHPDPEIRTLPKRVSRYDYWRIGEKDLAFLLQFTICNLETTLEAQDGVFGPVAEWLLDSILSDQESRRAVAERFKENYGRAKCCRGWADAEGRCPVDVVSGGSGSHSDAHLVVWEVMKMLWVTQHFPPWGLGSDVLIRYSPYPHHTSSQGNENDRGRLRSAVAVFFGLFRAEEVMLPLPIPPGRLAGALRTSPAVFKTEEEKNPYGTVDAIDCFNSIFNYSGQPNCNGHPDQPTTPLTLKFFEYFLQRHLGLCFDQDCFHTNYWDFDHPGKTCRDLVGDLTIFSHDDVGDRRAGSDFRDGSEMLTKYPPDFERIFIEEPV